MTTGFTLVSTVFNEQDRLQQTIMDLERQSCIPDEIVVVDAGSNDGTFEELQQWKNRSAVSIVLIQKKGCNVAEGRNLAIRRASSEVIVSTDFGCRFHKDWLKSLVEVLADENVEVVGGEFTVDETEIKTLAQKSDYVLQNGYKVVMDEYFSVSSRSIAFRKYVWEKIGGYPEWLTLAADDTIFWKLVRKHQFNYSFVRKPYVHWLRHKTNKGFSREAYRYGLGDGESKINYRNFWSNAIETLCRYLLFGLLLLTPFMGTVFSWPVLLLYFPLLIGLRSYRRAFVRWLGFRSSKYNVRVFLNCLLQIEQGRLQYIMGYVKGMTLWDQTKVEGRKQLWEILR